MTLIEQSLSGIRVVKAYRLEDYEAGRAATLTRAIRDLIVRAERVKAISSPLMETFGGVAVTIVIVYGGWRVIEGVTSAGAFFSFITALLSAYRPMKALATPAALVLAASLAVAAPFSPAPPVTPPPACAPDPQR